MMNRWLINLYLKKTCPKGYDHYKQEGGRRIMDHLNMYYYNQSGSIIKSIMLESRSKYELGLADAGAISGRTARINQSLRNFIYGPPGQMTRNLLEMAGGAVTR